MDNINPQNKPEYISIRNLKAKIKMAFPKSLLAELLREEPDIMTYEEFLIKSKMWLVAAQFVGGENGSN